MRDQELFQSKKDRISLNATKKEMNDRTILAQLATVIIIGLWS